ncbi:Glycogen/starch synthase, ADP-glucose type [Moorella glycerini]|uniref:Glycogen synthase n=1 Tax=Neomoorella stamsii TaxID=1266720 RepID=A0A9X7J5C1_9FIRM|nr:MULTISPECIES: glycogen synthase GlgA [Moorella]PRR74432.1 Glycogen synthase [Moorella stamsii]CEP67921.1 Glycogen/starch synthase, ADP-glucose type [Moorella glycerini]
MTEPLKILLVSSEVAPLAKTGGLADVAGSLPKALAARGHEVRVAMPRYRQVKNVDYLTDLPVEMDGSLETAIIRQAQLAGDRPVQVYLIDNYKFFWRDGMYCYSDDAARFNFFCKAVLSMLPWLGFQPDIIHCNDWQTGPIPLFLKVKHEDNPFYRHTATIYTIHNLQYQGTFPRQTLKIMALGEEFFTPERLEFYGQVSFMKAGILYADLINTVSKKYALEIQTPEYGERLDGLLRKRAADLRGILNGIDYQEFNPATDRRLAVNYDAGHLEKKKENKAALQREMDLPVKDVPLLGLISRLVNQKGLDLLAAILDPLLQQDLQFVLLGSGEDYYQQLFSRYKVKYRDKMAVKIGFDPVLAQRIYAGCDIFLMPSRFEPCGLGQMISLRYGTVPVVRATGGLEDTIKDFHQYPGSGNGFSFRDYQPQALLDTINRALHVYRNEPEEWRNLVRRGMAADFSWNASAGQYEDMYREALQKRMATQVKAG